MTLTTWQKIEVKQPTRSEMRKRLDRLKVAAKEIEDASTDVSTTRIFQGPASTRNLDMFIVCLYMRDVAIEAEKASADIPLGGGKGRIRSLADKLSAMEACASVIFEAWDFVHQKPPGINHGTVQDAAEYFWQVAGGSGPPKAEANDRWRNHLAAARNTNGEWRGVVRERLADMRKREEHASAFPLTNHDPICWRGIEILPEV